MILFEILNSPDDEVKETYKFFFNQVLIGRKYGNLLIQDTKLNESHIMLEVIEDKLLIHPQKDISHYLIDGKRSTSIRSISKNQKITIGETTLVIHDFSLTKQESKKEILNAKLDQLVKTNSPIISIIEKIVQATK